MSDSERDRSQRISPFYETKTPDEQITLIKESAEIVHPKRENLRALGTIEILQLWSPMRFRFRFIGTIECESTDEDELPLGIDWDYFDDEIEIRMKGLSLTGFVDGGSDGGLEGELAADEIILGTDHKLDRVTFHIPNYRNPIGGRVVQDRGEGDFGVVYDWSEIRLEALGWRIKLQPVRLVKELN